MVLCVGTQQKNLPHAVPHFDSVPSLSRDSDVGDLLVDLVASTHDPPVFRAGQVISLCNEHAHCDAILLVRIAWCLLSMISVHVQFKCEAFSKVARLHVSRQPLDADYPLRARYLPLDVAGTAAVTVHVVSTRRCVWTLELPPLASDDNRHEHLHQNNVAAWTSQRSGHFLRGRHLVSRCQWHVGLLPSLEVGSVRADVRSCCYGLDEAQLPVARREQPSLCPVSSRIWTLEGDNNWHCQDLLPTVWARGGRRLISRDFQLAKFHSGVGASRQRTLRGASGQTH